MDRVRQVDRLNSFSFATSSVLAWVKTLKSRDFAVNIGDRPTQPNTQKANYLR
jgi:hypothetical protein